MRRSASSCVRGRTSRRQCVTAGTDGEQAVTNATASPRVELPVGDEDDVRGPVGEGCRHIWSVCRRTRLRCTQAASRTACRHSRKVCARNARSVPRGIAVPSMASTWLTRSVAPIGPYLRAASRWFDNQTTRSSDTATCRRSLGSVRPDHDNLLSHVSWVCLERGGGRIRSAVEAATKRRLGYGFHMSGAPTDAGRDSLLHHSLNRLAAPDAGRWSLRPGHGQ
jgi:hypothetical protein